MQYILTALTISEYSRSHYREETSTIVFRGLPSRNLYDYNVYDYLLGKECPAAF